MMSLVCRWHGLLKGPRFESQLQVVPGPHANEKWYDLLKRIRQKYFKTRYILFVMLIKYTKSCKKLYFGGNKNHPLKSNQCLVACCNVNIIQTMLAVWKYDAAVSNTSLGLLR